MFRSFPDQSLAIVVGFWSDNAYIGSIHKSCILAMNYRSQDTWLPIPPVIRKGRETCRRPSPTTWRNQRETEDLMHPNDHCASSSAQPPLLFALPFLLPLQESGESCDQVTWLEALTAAHAHCALWCIQNPPPSPRVSASFHAPPRAKPCVLLSTVHNPCLARRSLSHTSQPPCWLHPLRLLLHSGRWCGAGEERHSKNYPLFLNGGPPV